MFMGRDGGGQGGRKKKGDCNSFTLVSSDQGAWLNFGASAVNFFQITSSPGEEEEEEEEEEEKKFKSGK